MVQRKMPPLPSAQQPVVRPWAVLPPARVTIGRFQVDRAAALNFLAFLLFSTVLLVRLVAHQMFRDEPQAWLIVEAARTPIDLFAVPSEVHPPLWYWILEFVQLFTSNLYAMKGIIGLFGLGTLALLWFVSSLNMLDKILISASYYTSWQYGVFSRNYLPGIFFLLLFSVLWPYWRRHPVAGGLVLGLACLTHAFFVPIAGILALLFVFDWWREQPSQKVLLFGAVLAFFTAAAVLSLYLSAPTFRGILDQAAPASESKQLLSRIGYAFTVDVVGERFEVIAGILFFAAFLPRLPVVLLSAVGALFLSAFQVFIYGGMAWHVGAIYFLFVCIYVVYHRDIYWYVPRTLLTLSAIGGVMVLVTHTLPYSTGEQAASLIRTSGLEKAHWTAFPDYGGVVPFAALGRPFWSIECDCQVTYVLWRNRNPHLDKETFWTGSGGLSPPGMVSQPTCWSPNLSWHL